MDTVLYFIPPCPYQCMGHCPCAPLAPYRGCITPQGRHLVAWPLLEYGPLLILLRSTSLCFDQWACPMLSWLLGDWVGSGAAVLTALCRLSFLLDVNLACLQRCAVLSACCLVWLHARQ
eukprot:IDg17664t1